MVTPAAISHALPISTNLQPSKIPEKAPRASENFNKILNKEVNRLHSNNLDIKNSKEVSRTELQSEISQIKKTDRAIQESYHSVQTRIQSNYLDEDGMKIALKELAKQFENQINSVLWHQILKKDTGSLGERLWSSERTSSFVKSGSDELGEIGENIYNILLEEMKVKGVIGGDNDK